MALNAQILLSILAHESDNGDISQSLRATPATYALALTDGTGANQAQVVWSDAGTATLAGVTLSLTALPTVIEGAAATVNLSSGMKCIYLRNKGIQSIAISSANVSGLPSSGLSVRAGGAMVLVATTPSSYAATSLGPSITLAGNDVDYDIILIGEGTVT